MALFSPPTPTLPPTPTPPPHPYPQKNKTENVFSVGDASFGLTPQPEEQVYPW